MYVANVVLYFGIMNAVKTVVPAGMIYLCVMSVAMVGKCLCLYFLIGHILLMN